MKKIKILLLLILCIPVIAFAKNSKEHMLKDLDVIKNTFSVKYAPKEWKKEYLGWDLDEQMEKAKQEVLSLDKATVKNYQKILKNFFLSAHDYHVGVQFYSTEIAALPFRVEGTEGRYFIVWVASQFIEENGPILNVGEEILAFNDQPIQEVIDELMKMSFGSRATPTDKKLVTQYVTLRGASVGHKVPKGAVRVKIRNKIGCVREQNVAWFYIPEKITSAQNCDVVKKSKTQKQNSPADYVYYRCNMSTPLHETITKNLNKAFPAETRHDDDHMTLLGGKKSFVPPLGNLICQSFPDAEFEAYLYETEDHHRIGYVRIGTYMVNPYVNIEEFQSLIEFFEEHSEALVIDQVNNPGGFALYMYGLASLLTDYPLVPPRERQAITQEEVYLAVQTFHELDTIKNDEDAVDLLGESLFGYSVSYDFVKSFKENMDFIISEWNAGHQLSDLNYVLGIDMIPPHPKAHYSKPILILVNELDISCGDYFPAIMQDNGRATLFGTKTAGAGGALLHSSHPNIFGIAEYSFTGSIAERVNRDPIENLGVTPDIEYAVTLDDMMHGYCGYKDAVNQAIKGIIDPYMGTAVTKTRCIR